MRMLAIGVVMVAACSSGGGGGGGGGSGSSSGSARAAGSGSAAATAADARPPVQLLTEDAVRALVADWLAAQNTGDFATYESLYAAKLEGIKRVRSRTWRFDRAGWMHDRQRMFAHPMSVQARDLDVRVMPTVAIVELVQSFAQGSFQDEGTKRIVVVVENNVPRIAREEMLQSRSAAPIGGDDRVHLIETGGGIYLQTGADPAWGSGPFRLEDTDLVLAAQDVTNAPAAVTAWHGKTVAVYAADGTPCSATIGSLYLQGGQTPHFGTRAEWRGDSGLDPYTDAQIAEEVFGTPYLMGELTVDGDCTPVVAIDGGAPVFFPAADAPDPELETSAVKAFRKTDEYRQIQDEYKDDGGSGAWAETPSVRVFGAPGGKRYVWVGASEGGGCAEFHGEMWTIFSVSATNRLKRIPIADAGTFEPVAVFDSNGDGAIELVARGWGSTGLGTYETYFEQSGGELVATIQIDYSYLDCPC